LQDLQKEVGALKRYLLVLEDRQIESMISVEEAETNYKVAKEKYEELNTKKLQQTTTLSAERSHLDLELKRLSTEREVVVQTINVDDLDIYEKLRSNRRGLAVSKIVDHSCGSCGTTLSPAIRQSAQSPTQIVQCPSCRRILYSG
jgi:predicted  nucleic acid-binding Zn-ribbon protein